MLDSLYQRFKVFGTITEISDILTVKSSENKDIKVLRFTVSYNTDKPKYIYFSLFGENKINKFLRFNDIGKSTTVFFTIDTRPYKDGYINNITAHSFWTPISNKPYKGLPDYPTENY